MIVYCDTSFLVSFLNEEDARHQAARRLAARFDRGDFVLCEVHQLELPGAVRAAIHREQDAIPAHVARRIINRFDRALTGKLFQRKEVSLADSVNMARSLGDAHGWTKKHTTFDLWHLGAAWALSAGAFLTFDERQGKLARTMGMKG
ncbi:MAG TPA: PIN domain-containing protein [Verrucomicrobiae bacterium]|nr:PIN domain-containing protein [Verrucomicrobiae bacterium]